MNRFGKSCGAADSKSRSRSIQIPAEGGGYRRPAVAILIISFIVLATVGAFALGEPDDSAGIDSADTVGDEQKCGVDLTWTLEDGTLTISGTGNMYDYSDDQHGPWTAEDVKKVVFSVNGMTGIGRYAFAGCKNISEITIPDCVKEIRSYAFRECTGLTGIDLNKVEFIDFDAFQDAFKHDKECPTVAIDIPNTVTKIETYAFSQSNLTSITIPGSVETIGEGAFDWCYYLSTVTFKDSKIATIDTNTFWKCISLKSIDIPSSVTTIGYGAFAESGLEGTVTIGKGISSIGNRAFADCTSLEEIYVDGDNTYYSNNGDGVLFNYDKSTLIQYPAGKTGSEYIIPNPVTTIGSYAFSICTNLTGITIQENVTSINGYAFNKCENLTGITIPEKVASIGDYAFTECKKLQTVTFKDPSESSLGSIGKYAFYRSGLKSIDIPDSVKTIDSYAFLDCSDLKTITFGTGIETAGEHVFAETAGISKYNDTTFDALGTQNINFTTDKLDKFKGWMFTYNDESAHMVAVDATTIDGVTYKIFQNEGGSDCSAHVTESDQGISGEKTICNKITLGHNTFFVTVINDKAFYERGSLIKVTIPDSVTTIGAYAFYKCEGLTSVTILGQITSIPNYAFQNCGELNSVILADDSMVTSIGTSAFESCGKLSSFKIPSSVTSIGSSAFSGCASLPSIEIPSSVTSILDYAFSECSKLSSIEIPSSVTSIGASAFSGCVGLSSITIPDSVETIGRDAFCCNNLKTIIFGTKDSKLSSINAEAFCNSSYNPTKFYDEKGHQLSITGDISKFKGQTFTGDISVMYIDVFGTYFCNGVIYTYDGTGEAHVSGFVDGIIAEETTILDVFTAHDKACSVTSIGDNAFKDCTTLTSITISDSVETIGGKAFGGCDNLKTIHFGNGITEIADDAFCDSKGTTTKFNDELSKQISTSSDIAKFRGQTFTGDISEMTIKTLGIRTYYGVIYVVPASGEAYVYGYTGDIKGETTILDSVTIDGVPYKVTSIGAGAFEDCTKLTSITIPDSVKDIKEYAFLNCTGLEIVSFGTGIETVDPNAFSTGKRGGDIDKTVFYDENHDPIDLSAQTEKLRGNLFKGDIHEMALAHTITIDDGTSSQTYIGRVGDKIPRPADPTRDGYKFLYWVDEDGNEFDWIIPAKDVKVTAVWKAVSPSGDDDDDNPPYNPSDNGSGSTDGSDGNIGGSTILIIVACIAAFMAVLAAYVCSNRR